MSADPISATLETRSKPWWQSKAIIGSVAAIAATVLGFIFKKEIRQEDVFELLTGLATVASCGFAIYGRIKAETQIDVRRATRATPVEIAQARGRGGNRKNGFALLRLLVTIVLSVAVIHLLFGCAGPDRTPDRRETDAAVSAVSKVPGAGAVFVFGVVTWLPVIVLDVLGDGPNTPEVAVWPFWITTAYWEAVP